MAVLELRGVGKSFGPVHAVADVDLRLAPGSRTAIVGPSGCGKTTLLRLIAGFETPDAGSVHLDGQLVADPGGAVPTHRRGIGLVSQDGALFPHLSIAGNIGFGLPRGMADREARIAALCDLAGLPRAALARRPHELSGGQQQRVALARALAQKPRLMLLDEPFSSLDAGLRAAMREAVIALLREADVASILVTHDQAEALSYADQVAVMYEGRLLQAGTPEDLYWHPRTRRTAEFLGPVLVLPATVAHGEGAGFVGECALGAVPLDHHHRTEIAPGQRGRLMLRPEQLQLVADAEGVDTVGTVVAVGFSGATSQVALRLDPPAPEAEVLSFTLPQPSCAPLHPGDRVSIAITGHAHLLDEPPAAAE